MSEIEDDLALRARLVCSQDMKTLFYWRNLDNIVDTTTQQDKVGWDDHCLWFQQRIKNVESEPLFILHTKQDVGMARFDFFEGSKNILEVSILIDPVMQGRGFGSKGMNILHNHVKTRNDISEIMARVRADNLRSLDFFLNLQYQRVKLVHGVWYLNRTVNDG